MKKLTTTQSPPVSRFIVNPMAYLCSLILALLPFHAFLTVWGSSLVGHYTLLRLWKEALLVLLVIGSVVLQLSELRRQPGGSDWLYRLRSRPVVLMILAYIVLLIGMGAAAVLTRDVAPKAFAYGLLLDARFLLFFLITWFVSRRTSWIVDHWRQILLIPAMLVVLFGLLQFTILPADFLGHFGYNASTIDAVQTVDQKSDYRRIQSTLRGANPLGAYLVIVVSALAVLMVRVRSRGWARVGALTASCAVLAATFSRSAWIGAIAALGWLTWQSIASGRMRKFVLIGGSLLLVLLAATGYALRNNDVFQNTVLHTDEHSRSSMSSNDGHLAAARSGVHDILHQPQGGGTGSAGPASAYNTVPARIAENYYLQIGQEVGIIGLLLFVVINLAVARELWLRRSALLPCVLLASLVGIALVNLLSHAWTDDTLSYIWWGLAGAAIGGIASSKKANHHEKT